MELQMTIWEAIAEMRKLTADNKPFSMVYMSYSRGRQASNGLVRVNRAVLRPQASSDQKEHADEMLNYLDRDLNIPRQFYQILLMEFNGYKTNPT